MFSVGCNFAQTNMNLPTNLPTNFRDTWEATGFELEKRQANPVCVKQEQEGLASRTSPPYSITYSPSPLPEGFSPFEN